MSLPDSIPDSCLALHARMVAQDTVNPAFGGPADGQAKLVDFLEAWSRARGLLTRRLPVGDGNENLLILAEGPDGSPWLLFDSHLDTVATNGMTVAPLTAQEVEGRIYGRGTCDTKGSGAAMLWALADFAREPRKTQTVALLFTTDEEVGMAGARAFARDQLPGILPRLRGIVVGEPTGLRPVVATNGILRWRTRTRGVAAHSSDPSRGRSAISAMMRLVDVFEGSYVPAINRTHPLTGKSAASINVIRGGSQVNVIPDECSIEVDRRLVPGETVEAAMAEMKLALAAFPEAEHDRFYSVPPLVEGDSIDFVRSLEPAFAAVRLPFARGGVTYVSNGSIYAQAGAKVLVLGPGDIAQAHSKDEWISRAQLRTAVDLYRSLMSRSA
jgi:acetylornithine deacetylase